jgi:hypothetical protein
MKLELLPYWKKKRMAWSVSSIYKLLFVNGRWTRGFFHVDDGVVREAIKLAPRRMHKRSRKKMKKSLVNI